MGDRPARAYRQQHNDTLVQLEQAIDESVRSMSAMVTDLRIIIGRTRQAVGGARSGVDSEVINWLGIEVSRLESAIASFGALKRSTLAGRTQLSRGK